MTGQDGQDGRAQGAAPEDTQSLPGPLLRELRPPYQRQSGQVAAVLMYENGGYSVLWPDGREDHRKPWLRSPYTVFEIALGRNVTRFDLQLPARGDAEFFQAGTSVHWKVEDPIAVVRNQVRDVAALLRDELLDQLREASRRFRLTEAQQADEAVRAELNSGRLTLGSDLGLSLRVHVFIDLSERVMERVREGAGLDHRLELTGKEHALQRKQEQYQAQIVRERARNFESVLMGGDESKIAYFMAKDPGRALEIEQLFARERRQGQADWLEFIGKLIDGGQLERHDIGEHMYEVLQHLRNRSSGVVGGTMGLAFPEEPEPRRALDSAPPPPRTRRRPFWEDGEDGEGGEDGEDGEGGEGGVAEPEGLSVHEPSMVESAEERAERAGEAGPFDAPDSSRPSRASDRFDDWGDS